MRESYANGMITLLLSTGTANAIFNLVKKYHLPTESY